MGYETLQYDILLKDGPYEIRKYEPFVKMVTKSSYDSGFSKLFRYISGYNKESKKIAMTVPVISEVDYSDMAFTMPKKIEALGIPEPLDESIKIIKEPEKYYLSYTFKGNKDLNKVLGVLYVYAEKHYLEIIGTPKIMTYQGPMMPGFLKTYDVIIEIKPELYGDV
jgi:hypothetical protein